MTQYNKTQLIIHNKKYLLEIYDIFYYILFKEAKNKVDLFYNHVFNSLITLFGPKHFNV